MARIRSIHPGLASDEAFMSMSFPAQAGWPLLWTECDDHGIFEWKPLVLKARIFPAASIDFAELLTEWERLGCIQKVEIDGKTYGLVRNFCKYQRPKNPSYRYDLPEEYRNYVGLNHSNSGGLPQSSPSTTENPPQMKDEGGRRKEEGGNKNSREREEIDSDFEAWYREYPRHEGRGQALKAYRTARKKLDADGLLAAARRARERYRGTEPKFIPLPATFLNGERWLDEPAQPAESGPDLNDIYPPEIYRGLQ